MPSVNSSIHLQESIRPTDTDVMLVRAGFIGSSDGQEDWVLAHPVEPHGQLYQDCSSLSDAIIVKITHHVLGIMHLLV
jgi:hypothetical protein